MTKMIDTVANSVSSGVQKGQLSNNDLVQIIELCGAYLNLKSRSQYAKANNISYNGAKRFRENVLLFGTIFIIDND